MSNSCILNPEAPNGEPSRMYRDFLSKDGLRYPRPVANMLYASYKVSNLEAKMEAEKNADGSPKYHKNSQGEFNAKDVVDYLDFDKAIGEFNSFSEEEYRLGATDAIGGNRVDYTDAEVALNKVDHFNSTHRGLVATVIERPNPSGTVYQIMVYQKNSRTLDLPLTTQERLKAWDIYKQVFNNVGVDITSMPTELSSTFSAYNTSLGRQLRNLTKITLGNIFRKDALTLFYLDQNSAEVQRLIKSFGSIEDAAQAMDDINHGGATLQQGQATLLKRAITHAQQMQGIDLNALIAQVDQMQTANQAASPEVLIKQEVKNLDKKYHIEKYEINRYNNEIRTLSEATAEATVQLERKINELIKQQGRNAEGRRLEIMLEKMRKELGTKHYYSGIISFLAEAGRDIASIDTLLQNVPQSGTDREIVFGTIKVLKQIKEIHDQYGYIVSALASDYTAMDEDISQIDVDNIKQQAKNLDDYFKKKERVLEELTTKTMHDFMRMATGGKMTESEIQDMLSRALKGASLLDKFLYSAGNANNILIAASGTIMRNQEIERDRIMTAYRKRIDVATDKLYKAGYDTKFMYEDQRHIVSDIDWKGYESAREAKLKSLRKQGLDGFQLKQEMEDWEDQNTEDRVVDHVNGRTEKVPNQQYRKLDDFQEGWSQEQIDYYDTMMQLKGEMDSIYPDAAQHHYFPPQVRRNTVDALSEAKGIKDVGKALGNKAKDMLWAIREDDTSYGQMNIVGGEIVKPAEGNYNNKVKKEIPISFQNPVEEGELLLDFSSGMARYAGSAINYDSANSIVDALEFVRDWADSKDARAASNETQINETKFLRTTKDLYDFAKSNDVVNILNGFIDQHIYGIKKKTTGTIDKHTKVVKFLDNIIKYTSFKGLVTNLPGATANALMGVNQILIDAGCGEFFGFKDLAWATGKLFGETGVGGDMMEVLTNNRNHKATLFREIFDPMQESFGESKDKRYYSSMFRQIIGKDLSFLGYSSGEYLIHILPMYAILHKQQVRLNGEKINLYDAFEKVSIGENNAKLELKQGVTDLDGNPITQEFIDKVKGKIRAANQSMHGAMNEEDKGLIHQYILGRLTMNFRQWMVGHYSRRFRGRHFDFSTGDWREGYWVSVWKGLTNDETKGTWKQGEKMKAIGMFMKDAFLMLTRAQTQWNNLNDHQKYNVKRVRTELIMLVALTGLGFVLGEPDDHKKEFWRRWWIYQTKRMITETESSMPGYKMPGSLLTILQSPMAGINTLNSMLYVLYGLTNGDLTTEIKSGRYKGWNKYGRNVLKYTVPFWKDWENLQKFSEDDSLFKVFESTPSNH